MIKITPKTFNLPNLAGISQRTIENHLKLYTGYIENANKLLEEISEVKDDDVADDMGRLLRAYAFEFDGVRNHEAYFGMLSGGSTLLPEESEFEKQLISQGCTYADCMDELKSLALTRGIGWAVLGYDPDSKFIMKSWIDEQHVGQLQGVIPLIAIDMWEHSYLMDYESSEKNQYVQNLFTNINWQTIEDKFKKINKNE